MEVEGAPAARVERTLSGGGGSISVSLHPLVIMNISDHFTRVRVQGGAEQQPASVYGALLGVQRGRCVEVCNSFELVVSADEKNGRAVLDQEYFAAKEEQFKQVFSLMELLGWYTTGEAPSEGDAHFHQQVCTDNETGLLLKVNPLARTNQLPVTLFESLIEIVDGERKVLFSRVPYSLATEDAERIGVDHVARASVAGASKASVVAEQLSAQHGAVKMLHSRVRVILDYLRAVQAGDLPKNHEVLREVSSLCAQLPVLDRASFQSEFYCQTNDVLLMCYLATITKGIATASEFVAKVNVVYDRHGIGRRTRGLLF